MSTPLNLPPASQRVGGETTYPFHRLMRRSESYRWWKPLAFAGAGTGFYGVLLVIAILVVILAMLANPMTWSADPSESASGTINGGEMNMASPLDFSLTMISLILMIPAVYVAYLLLGPKPVGLLLSVAGKMRWRWFGLAIGTSAVLFALYFGLSLGLSAAGVGDSGPVPASGRPADPLFFAILVLLLTPFQCAAEELVFRGALMQVIGSWLKHPLFAILLPVPLFTFGHIYDAYGLLDVAFFAVAAGYLTWRTGGLEAAIAVHIINNTFLFLLGAMGQMDLNAQSSAPIPLVFSIAFTGLLTFVLAKLAGKHNLQRTAGPIPPSTKPALLQPWPMAQPLPAPRNQAYWAPPAHQPQAQSQDPIPPVHAAPPANPEQHDR